MQKYYAMFMRHSVVFVQQARGSQTCALPPISRYFDDEAQTNCLQLQQLVGWVRVMRVKGSDLDTLLIKSDLKARIGSESSTFASLGCVSLVASATIGAPRTERR